MKFKLKDKDGIFKSIFTAYLILFGHIFLLAGIGLLVVLFKGFYQYLPWIMSGIALWILFMTWFFYRQMKEKSSTIKDLLSFPEFRDRTVEVKLLGGLATFTMKAKDEKHMHTDHDSVINYSDKTLLTDATSETEQKIMQLTVLYEKNLLTKDEFERKKQDIING